MTTLPLSGPSNPPCARVGAMGCGGREDHGRSLQGSLMVSCLCPALLRELSVGSQGPCTVELRVCLLKQMRN